MPLNGSNRHSSTVETALIAAVRAALPDDAERVSVSRAGIIPVDAFAGPAVEQLPVVWGRTVWETATGLCVVEHPNGLGRFEVDAPDGGVHIDTGAPSRDLDPQAVARASVLRKALLQGRGVVPALPTIDSARFVVLFPVPPSVVLDVDPPDGVLASTLDPGLVEYAGGIRFDVAADAVESDLTAYAAEIRARA